jgi:metal-responsive CopG/Arc/MetJ family transcriptional regulator
MPKKLDDEIQRLHMVVPTALIEKVDAWRRREDDLPNLSEAIRRLVEMGLESAKKARQQGR